MLPFKHFKNLYFFEDIKIWIINLSAFAASFTAIIDLAKFGLIVVSFLYTGYKLFRLVMADASKKLDKRVEDILKEEDSDD